MFGAKHSCIICLILFMNMQYFENVFLPNVPFTSSELILLFSVIASDKHTALNKIQLYISQL